MRRSDSESKAGYICETIAEDATRLARLRYSAGSTNYLEVLTNDTNYYSAQLNLAMAQEQEALSIVQLYSALGGGWQ
jgi:multidrug efflux system outer membrane protein